MSLSIRKDEKCNNLIFVWEQENHFALNNNEYKKILDCNGIKKKKILLMQDAFIKGNLGAITVAINDDNLVTFIFYNEKHEQIHKKVTFMELTNTLFFK